MRLEHYPVEKFKKEIIEIIGKQLDLNEYRVFFFGSRVSGNGTERSDIDIGIKGSKPIPIKSWIEIQEDIENFSSLYKIEIVDFGAVAPKFEEVALRQIELISPI